MRHRIILTAPSLWAETKRLAFLALMVCGGGALVVVVFALSFFLAMRVEMHSSELLVPDVTGSTFEEASATLEPLQLVPQVVEQRNDPAVASGRVLQQSPTPGAAVRRGRKVKLILSLGGRVLRVPDMLGQPDRTAAIELAQGGFIPGDEARVRSAAAPVGTVIAQVPPPDTPAVPRTRVHRLVSDGPPRAAWVMPDLTGLDRDRVERWVARSGFRRGPVRRIRTSGAEPNTVVGQHPLAGYPVHPRDVVELTVVE